MSLDSQLARLRKKLDFLEIVSSHNGDEAEDGFQTDGEGGENHVEADEYHPDWNIEYPEDESSELAY